MKWHTRRGLSLENDLLRSDDSTNAHSNKTRFVFAHRYERAYIYTIIIKRYTCVSFCICCFSPRPFFSPLATHRRGRNVPLKRRARARMICNFNNQSHERRLIFIMIAPPLYISHGNAAFEVPIQIGPDETKELHRSLGAKGTLRLWLV